VHGTDDRNTGQRGPPPGPPNGVPDCANGTASAAATQRRAAHDLHNNAGNDGRLIMRGNNPYARTTGRHERHQTDGSTGLGDRLLEVNTREQRFTRIVADNAEFGASHFAVTVRQRCQYALRSGPSDARAWHRA
jgi:hypothetical protein